MAALPPTQPFDCLAFCSACNLRNLCPFRLQKFTMLATMVQVCGWTSLRPWDWMTAWITFGTEQRFFSIIRMRTKSALSR